MKKLKLFYFSVLAGLLISTFSCTDSDQAPNPLEGLTKTTYDDLNLPPDFDFDAIPYYSIDGKLIEKESLMDIILEGDYTPEPYINQDSLLTIYKMRKSTPEEKEQTLRIAKMMQKNTDLVGTSAKDFSVTDLEGNEFSLESLKGDILVINFWFIGCPPCVKEIPELNELVEQYEDQVKFLAFATDQKEELEAFLAETPFNYHIIPESGDVVGVYGVMGFPTHLVVDRNSKITYSTVGLGLNTIQELDTEINKLLAD